MRRSDMSNLRRRIAILGALLGVLAWESSSRLAAADWCSTCQVHYASCLHACQKIDQRIRTHCDENCSLNFDQCESTCK